MTKYRKGPQMTAKDPQRSITQDHRGSAILQRTAKEHYGLSCRKLAPIELNGALYSSARQDFYILPDLVENLRSLIASQYAEADHTICGRGNFILRLSHQKHRLSVADWKALSEP